MFEPSFDLRKDTLGEGNPPVASQNLFTVDIYLPSLQVKIGGICLVNTINIFEYAHYALRSVIANLHQGYLENNQFSLLSHYPRE
jgi:hypothetical protein